MNRSDTESVLKKVEELWPGIDWPADVRTEFARRVAQLPITREQANSVLVNVRLSKPFRTCEPSDLLGPLRAVAQPAATEQIDSGCEAEIVRRAFETEPDAFRNLCNELHAEIPRTPPHFRDAPHTYWMWPTSRKWLAKRIIKYFHKPKQSGRL